MDKLNVYALIKEEINIIDIAKELGFTPEKVGNRYYTLKEHDSVRIDPEKNYFFQNSTGAKGSVIDFVSNFTGMTSKEVVNSIIDSYDYLKEKTMLREKQLEKEVTEKNRTLELPKRDTNLKNVYAYLINTRGIDKEIVSEFIKNKNLYQDEKKNCVFVAYKDDKPIFANKRGTNTYKKFVADIRGCDYAYGFFIDNNADKLIITESVIDAMSKMCLLKQENIDYHSYNFLSLSGTGKVHDALEYHYKAKNYDEIRICTDSDDAGLLCSVEIDKYLYNAGFEGKLVKDLPKNKDINEDLLANQKNEKKKELQFKDEFEL